MLCGLSQWPIIRRLHKGQQSCTLDDDGDQCLLAYIEVQLDPLGDSEQVLLMQDS